MRAALISLGSVSSVWTFDAMKKYFEEVDHIDLKNLEVDLGGRSPKVLDNGQPLKNYDCVYLKGSFKYLQILNSVASVLQKDVYVPFSPSSFLLGHDKLLTHLSLQQHNIAMPETYISASSTAARQILEKIAYPIVLKFPSGTQGKGVMFADSYNSAISILDAMSALNQPVIIQKYVETGGADLRIIVCGDKVIAAMQRQADEGERRANFHAGGKCSVVEIDHKVRDLAVRTAEVIGARICAVDILKPAGKNPVVIEVNLSPGLQGITEATGINVADRIAKFIYDETVKFKGSVSLGDGTSSDAIVDTVKLSRGKLVLPSAVTKMSGLADGDEILIKAEKNRILVTKGKGL